MDWLESKQLKIDPPKRTKKIPGTRFATILGLNPWSSQFEVWAAITKTYEKPFEDTIYTIAEKEKRLKKVTDLLKEHAMTQFRDGDKKVEVKGSRYCWTVARSETTTIDKDAMKADGVLDKYSKKAETYRMTVK